MNNREKLEALFQVESKSLSYIDKTYEQLAAVDQKRKKMRALTEQLLHETRVHLLNTQIYNLQQNYMLKVIAVRTEEERKHLIANYEKEVAELQKQLPN